MTGKDILTLAIEKTSQEKKQAAIVYMQRLVRNREKIEAELKFAEKEINDFNYDKFDHSYDYGVYKQ